MRQTSNGWDQSRPCESDTHHHADASLPHRLITATSMHDAHSALLLLTLAKRKKKGDDAIPRCNVELKVAKERTGSRSIRYES